MADVCSAPDECHMAADGFAACPLGECVERHSAAAVRDRERAERRARAARPLRMAAAAFPSYLAWAEARRRARQSADNSGSAPVTIEEGTPPPTGDTSHLISDNGVTCSCGRHSGPLPSALATYICPCGIVTPRYPSPAQYAPRTALYTASIYGTQAPNPNEFPV